MAIIAPNVASAQDTVRLMYTAPEAVSLGEPIVVNVTATNGSSRAVEVQFGLAGDRNFQISVGPSSTAQTTVRRQAPIEMAWGGTFTLAPGAKRTQAIIITQRLSVTSDGRLDIGVHFGGIVRAAAVLVAAEPRDFALSVRVLRRDPGRLRQRLADLVQIAESDQDWYPALEALLSVQDPLAVPYFVQLTGHPRSAQAGVQGLVNVGGAEARAALEELAQSGPPRVAASARSALAQGVR